MFYPCMSCLPGWAVYHGYQNLDEEDAKPHTPHDVETIGELNQLSIKEQKIPKPK